MVKLNMVKLIDKFNLLVNLTMDNLIMISLTMGSLTNINLTFQYFSQNSFN
jgi:hypothetical protein